MSKNLKFNIWFGTIIIILFVAWNDCRADDYHSNWEPTHNKWSLAAGPLYSMDMTKNADGYGFVNLLLGKEFPLSEHFYGEWMGMYGVTTNLDHNLQYLSADVLIHWEFMNTDRIDLSAFVGGGLLHWLNSDGNTRAVSGVMNFDVMSGIRAKVAIGKDKKNDVDIRVLYKHNSCAGTSFIRAKDEDTHPNEGGNYIGLTAGITFDDIFKRR